MSSAHVTFSRPFEEDLAAPAGEGSVVAPRGFISTDQAGLLRRKVIVNGQDVLPASVQPAASNRKRTRERVSTRGWDELLLSTVDGAWEDTHGNPRTSAMGQAKR